MLINCLVAGNTTIFGHCGIPEKEFFLIDSVVKGAGVARSNIAIINKSRGSILVQKRITCDFGLEFDNLDLH